jgi:hypothetical protein
VIEGESYRSRLKPVLAPSGDQVQALPTPEGPVDADGLWNVIAGSSVGSHCRSVVQWPRGVGRRGKHLAATGLVP